MPDAGVESVSWAFSLSFPVDLPREHSFSGDPLIWRWRSPMLSDRAGWELKDI